MKTFLLFSLFVFLSCTNASKNDQNNGKDSAKKAIDSSGKEIIRKTPG
jgi:hypothetical protein